MKELKTFFLHIKVKDQLEKLKADAFKYSKWYKPQWQQQKSEAAGEKAVDVPQSNSRSQVQHGATFGSFASRHRYYIIKFTNKNVSFFKNNVGYLAVNM